MPHKACRHTAIWGKIPQQFKHPLSESISMSGLPLHSPSQDETTACDNRQKSENMSGSKKTLQFRTRSKPFPSLALRDMQAAKVGSKDQHTALAPHGSQLIYLLNDMSGGDWKGHTGLDVCPSEKTNNSSQSTHCYSAAGRALLERQENSVQAPASSSR